MPKAQPTVISYGAELLAVFKAASKETITICLEDENKADRLRFRLNMLRKAMRNEQHWLASVAETVEVCKVEEIDPGMTISNSPMPTGNWLIVCKPSDNDFRTAIESALGKSVEETLMEGRDASEIDEAELRTREPEEGLSIQDMIEEMTRAGVAKEVESPVEGVRVMQFDKDEDEEKDDED